jgi:hypothetical protein
MEFFLMIDKRTDVPVLFFSAPVGMRDATPQRKRYVPLPAAHLSDVSRLPALQARIFSDEYAALQQAHAGPVLFSTALQHIRFNRCRPRAADSWTSAQAQQNRSICRVLIFFQKPLHTSNTNLYNSGLFGRNDKRQVETSEGNGRLAQLVERIPYKD